ncbi:hypothetical protein B0H10DRAFT_2242140 [Mycena sp. CBHHK59/15]|nr:hypothetical protein B0H10DRAFT_2242140 [Mycena sp. CBHHK59/15]
MCPHVHGDRPAQVKPASLGKVEWEVASLNAVLNEVVQMREDLREGMHIIFWCKWLLELASERAEQELTVQTISFTTNFPSSFHRSTRALALSQFTL